MLGFLNFFYRLHTLTNMHWKYLRILIRVSISESESEANALIIIYAVKMREIRNITRIKSSW